MKNLILIFVLAFTINSCNTSDDSDDNQLTLPPITQTGENTFGCYIDGKLLIPRDGTGTFGGSDDGASFYGGFPNTTDYYEIDIRDFKSERTAKILIHMEAVHENGIGSYIIDESNGMSSIDGLDHTYIHCKVFDNVTNSYQYYRSFEGSGSLNINRYDFENRIISGTINCSVTNSANPNDTIEITEGRFDLKWDTLPNTDFP